MQHFSAWFRQQSWNELTDWQRAAGGWHARFTHGEGSDRAVVDIQVGPDGRAGLIGFIAIAQAESAADPQPPGADAQPPAAP